MAAADVSPYVRDISPPGAAGRDNANILPADGLDDLFDYDASMDPVWGAGLDAPVADTAKSGPNGKGGASDGLGIDEEIQVTKKKRVNVKLDEDRLLSQAGIPKLRRISKERLRFKGKGHEVRRVQG